MVMKWSFCCENRVLSARGISFFSAMGTHFWAHVRLYSLRSSGPLNLFILNEFVAVIHLKYLKPGRDADSFFLAFGYKK
jgi:hypothetical protein